MIAVQAAACAADDVVGFRDVATTLATIVLAHNLRIMSKLLPKPLLNGVISEREGAIFAGAATLGAILAALGAVAALRWNIPRAAPLGYCLVFLFAFQYSWGLKLSYRPGGLELVVFVVNVGTVLLPYWSIAHSLSRLALNMSILVGVWFLLVVCYGNAADREGDAAVGRRTFAVLADPPLYRAFLVGLYLLSVFLTVLPFVLGLLNPLDVIFLAPLLAMSTLQVYRGAIRGDSRAAMRIGFRCIDLGGLGFAAAILLS